MADKNHDVIPPIIVQSPPKKLRKTTAAAAAAKLSDDVIIEIIARLPLKYAIQCSTLNKTLYRRISHPKFARRLSSRQRRDAAAAAVFHCSCHHPKTFTRVSQETTPLSITTNWETSILASCNGVLLLRFSSVPYYVFNPTTCGMMFVGYTLDLHDDVGLAVDLDAEKSQFTLVTIDIHPQEVCQSIVKFSVIVPFGQCTWVKSRVDLVCEEKFIRMDEINIRPVYVHGCLYWLGDDGRKMIVFDVKKEEARIVDGPVKDNENVRGVDKWFGLADGSLHFVCTIEDEIVIRSHDCVEDEWQVKHKIGNYICNYSCSIDYRNGMPWFFDGGRLFFYLGSRGGEGEVHVYDVMREKWAKSENMGKWADGKQVFFSFFPTLAKVSDKYLYKYNTLIFRDSLVGLHQLLR